MIARTFRSVVLILLTSLFLTGCGRQVAKDPPGDPALLATGPVSPPAPQPFIVASIEATGGLPAWTQCRRLDFDAIVTADEPDGGLYLTQHHFSVFPWSDAIEVTAGGPRAELAWRTICGRYSFDGDPSMDVSPLRNGYREYAEAVLQIVTAPARMMDPAVSLTRRPVPVQRTGQWYQPIEAKFQPKESVVERGDKQGALVEPYWTRGIYFQNTTTAVVDTVWLANPIAGTFRLVRGYDYARFADGVMIPTKIEVFHSDAEAHFGPRIASIDMKR